MTHSGLTGDDLSPPRRGRRRELLCVDPPPESATSAGQVTVAMGAVDVARAA